MASIVWIKKIIPVTSPREVIIIHQNTMVYTTFYQLYSHHIIYIYITYIQYITYPKYIYILYIYYLYILSIYIYPLYPFCLLDSHHLPHSPTVSPLPPHQRALPPGAFRAGRPRIELPQLWNMTTLPCFFGKDNG